MEEDSEVQFENLGDFQSRVGRGRQGRISGREKGLPGGQILKEDII